MPPHFNKTLKKIDSVFSYQSTCLHAKDAFEYILRIHLPSTKSENRLLGVVLHKTYIPHEENFDYITQREILNALFVEWLLLQNPTSQGRLCALKRDLENYPLNMVSWAVELNCVKNVNTGKYFNWFVDWQFLPINKSLNRYFVSEYYVQRKEKAYNEDHYLLDMKKFNLHKPKINKLAEVII